MIGFCSNHRGDAFGARRGVGMARKDSFVFPGGRPRQPLSGMAMAMCRLARASSRFTAFGAPQGFGWPTTVWRR